MCFSNPRLLTVHTILSSRILKGPNTEERKAVRRRWALGKVPASTRARPRRSPCQLLYPRLSAVRDDSFDVQWLPCCVAACGASTAAAARARRTRPASANGGAGPARPPTTSTRYVYPTNKKGAADADARGRKATSTIRPPRRPRPPSAMRGPWSSPRCRPTSPSTRRSSAPPA
jgi:hypothetical protein